MRLYLSLDLATRRALGNIEIVAGLKIDPELRHHAEVVPVQPSPFDVWACADLVEMIDARRAVTEGKPLAYFVVSKAIKGTKLSGEVSAALKVMAYPFSKLERRSA